MALLWVSIASKAQANEYIGDLIPALTANDSASPIVVTPSSEWEGNELYKAFNDTNLNVDDAWWPSEPGPANFVIDLGEAKSFGKFTLTVNANALTSHPKDFRLFGSNDGSSYTLLSSYSAEIFTEGEKKEYDLGQVYKYRYIKFDITEGALVGDYLSVGEFELIGVKEEVVEPPPLPVGTAVYLDPYQHKQIVDLLQNTDNQLAWMVIVGSCNLGVLCIVAYMNGYGVE